MGRTVTLAMTTEVSGERDAITTTFDGKEWDQLMTFLREVEGLADARLGREGFEPQMRAVFKEGQPTVYESKLPPWNDVMALLHRLRPLLLENEPSSFKNTCSLLHRHFSGTIFRRFLKREKDVYSGRVFREGIAIRIDDVVVNSEAVLRDWLYSCEYHRDSQQRKTIDDLLGMMPMDGLRAVFVMMIVEKIKAIRGLERIVRVLAGEAGREPVNFRVQRASPPG